MTKNTYDLTKDPLFTEAVNAAKSIAQSLSADALSPPLLLAGLLLAARKNSALREMIASQKDAIEKTLTDTGFKFEESYPSIVKEKYPVAPDLRKLIAARLDSLVSFVDSIVTTVSHATQIDDPAYLRILALASAISSKLNVDSITPEILSAAGYICFIQGALPPNQALSNLFLNNHIAFEVIIQDLGFDTEIKPSGDQKLYPISSALQSAIISEGSKQEKILAALNVGLKTGHKKLARRATAYHEAGHAIASTILRPLLSVTKVTIKAERESDGATHYDQSSPYWDICTTKSISEAVLITALSGRAAQIIKYGKNQIDYGSSDDIKQATECAWVAVANMGMDEELGPINLDVITEKQGEASGWLFDFVQRRVQVALNEAAEKAEKILRANWKQVEILVEELLTRETVNESQFVDNLVEKSLIGDPSSQKARSRPISRRIRFAQAPGILETSEGPVRYSKGDPIIEDKLGAWPTTRGYLERYYQPPVGLAIGQDREYTKRAQDVHVLKLQDVKRLVLPNGKGVLFGKAGDWLVDYGDGQFSIVNSEEFSKLYDIVA